MRPCPGKPGVVFDKKDVFSDGVYKALLNIDLDQNFGIHSQAPDALAEVIKLASANSDDFDGIFVPVRLAAELINKFMQDAENMPSEIIPFGAQGMFFTVKSPETVRALTIARQITKCIDYSRVLNNAPGNSWINPNAPDYL